MVDFNFEQWYEIWGQWLTPDGEEETQAAHQEDVESYDAAFEVVEEYRRRPNFCAWIQEKETGRICG